MVRSSPTVDLSTTLAAWVLLHGASQGDDDVYAMIKPTERLEFHIQRYATGVEKVVDTALRSQDFLESGLPLERTQYL